jgi:hypothetical protein
LLNIESLLILPQKASLKKIIWIFITALTSYLIDFSNHAFYNSRLKPLPTKSDTLPIEFFQVDGVFDDHTNKEEAEKVRNLTEN